MADTNPWLPFVSAAFGAAVTLIATAVTHALTSGRERQARRVEFQRKTLTELQDTVVELQRATVAASLAAQGGPTLETLQSPEFAKILHSLMILSTRIQHPRLRALVMTIRTAASQALMARSRDVAIGPLNQLASSSEAALELAGQLLIDML